MEYSMFKFSVGPGDTSFDDEPDEVDKINARIDYNSSYEGALARSKAQPDRVKAIDALNLKTNMDTYNREMSGTDPVESEFVKVLVAQQELDKTKAEAKKKGLELNPFHELAEDVMKSLLA